MNVKLLLVEFQPLIVVVILSRGTNYLQRDLSYVGEDLLQPHNASSRMPS